MSTLHSTTLLLALLTLSAPAWSQPLDDPRALLFQARAKQQQAGGDDAREPSGCTRGSSPWNPGVPKPT